jgi:hypothetical protein
MENKSSFIETYYLEDLSICDRLINLHKKSEEKNPGRIYLHGQLVPPTPHIKDSIDLTISDYFKHSEITDYVQQLNQIIGLYVKKYEFCNWYNPWTIIEPINIQHYKPGGGYKIWHTERTSNNSITSTRHLVFMTYLNDVTDDGETEFFYQETKIQPKKGLTVIWPADWTHTHRGIPSMTQEKYIITGWYNYIEKNI